MFNAKPSIGIVTILTVEMVQLAVANDLDSFFYDYGTLLPLNIVL